MGKTLTQWVEEANPAEWVHRTGFLDVSAQEQQTKLQPENLVSIATWNVSAVNANPFEYWMSYPDDPNYDKMMKSVEELVLNPGDKDIPISEIFTEDMFAQLNQRMIAAGWEHLDDVAEFWNTDYKARRIMSGFLKDKLLGKKRLMSMGDRVTNTLNTKQGTIYRPTIINAFTEDMSSSAVWWDKWLTFMFDTTVTVQTKKGEKTDKICTLLLPIKKAKYEAITEREEQISIPLQTMCLAIFDAVLLHIVNLVAPEAWQPIKKSLCDSLILNKSERCCNVLKSYYKKMSIICLQEVSAVMIDLIRVELGSQYIIVAPGDADGTRDQNSILLLAKEKFKEETVEITQKIIATFPPENANAVMAGDLIAVTCQTLDEQDMVVASFHGDSNGKATPLVVKSLTTYVQEHHANSKYLFGIDANSTCRSDNEKLQVPEFLSLCEQLNLKTNWGESVKVGNEAYTSFIGRSFLQPQLQKGIKYDDLVHKGDRDLKDYILYKPSQLDQIKYWKDCSGGGTWIENSVMPTYNFPSDHAILAMSLMDKQAS